MRRIVGMSLMAALLGAGAAQAQEVDPRWKFSTGADYSTGDYGEEEDTQYLSVPLEAEVTIDRVRLAVSVPWVSVDGPSQIAGGGPTGGTSEDTGSRSGLGDVVANAAVAILRSDDHRSAVELGGRVKFPTADDDIGTGEMDFAAMINGRAAVSASTILFGSIGYEWMGESDTLAYEDGVEASVGVNISPNQRGGFGGAISFREAYVAGQDDRILVSPYVYTPLTDQLWLALYGGAGLTDTSPDFFAGFRLSVYK